MENYKSINEILVRLFRDILDIEEKCLCRDEFSDLTMTEMHIIEHIGLDQERSMSSTAKDLKITSGTLTTAVDNLIKKNYVIRRRSEDDRRVVMIKLTEKGKYAYKYHEDFHSDMVKKAAEKLTLEEEIILIKTLTNVEKYFKEKYKL